MQISPFPFSLFFFFFSFLIHMAWRHRMQGTEIGFFLFLSKRHVANWETSILIRWICWQGKEGVSEALCLLEGVVLMGRHRRVRWCLPFLYTVSLLFSSGLYGSLNYLKVPFWDLRFQSFWVDGWRGLSWCWEGLSSKKKKKSHLCLCALTKMKTVSCFVFSCFYSYSFSPKWAWVIERGKPSRSNKFGDVVPFGHEAPSPF